MFWAQKWSREEDSRSSASSAWYMYQFSEADKNINLELALGPGSLHMLVRTFYGNLQCMSSITYIIRIHVHQGSPGAPLTQSHRLINPEYTMHNNLHFHKLNLSWSCDNQGRRRKTHWNSNNIVSDNFFGHIFCVHILLYYYTPSHVCRYRQLGPSDME